MDCVTRSVFVMVSYLFCSDGTFADPLNESGVLQNYCSLDSTDKQFGTKNGSIFRFVPMCSVDRGRGCPPPFRTECIRKVLNAFEEGFRLDRRHCRCTVLSLGSSYGVLEAIQNLSTEGKLLVSIPPGSMPFKNQGMILSTDNSDPKPSL